MSCPQFSGIFPVVIKILLCHDSIFITDETIGLDFQRIEFDLNFNVLRNREEGGPQIRNKYLFRFSDVVDIEIIAVARVAYLLHSSVLVISHAKAANGEINVILPSFFDQTHQLTRGRNAHVEIPVSGKNNPVVSFLHQILPGDLDLVELVLFESDVDDASFNPYTSSYFKYHHQIVVMNTSTSETATGVYLAVGAFNPILVGETGILMPREVWTTTAHFAIAPEDINLMYAVEIVTEPIGGDAYVGDDKALYVETVQGVIGPSMPVGYTWYRMQTGAGTWETVYTDNPLHTDFVPGGFNLDPGHFQVDRTEYVESPLTPGRCTLTVLGFTLDDEGMYRCEVEDYARMRVPLSTRNAYLKVAGDLGIDRTFEKPFRLQEVLQSVNELLGLGS